MAHAAAHDHGVPTSFVKRWLFSTNHKDIGTLNLIIAIIAGIIGGLLSVIMRFHHVAWSHHDLLHGDAGFDRWFCQLDGSDHDRRA